jgi:hypothetical protein
VAKVDAIEGADGDHRVGNVSSFYDVSENFHGFKRGLRQAQAPLTFQSGSP